ncbi:M15 family metallopeptidase [Lysinibacillus sp. NPDC097195]|uniref:M15 family metallopeptidase n=1 Tax=Lysinibacillus sp. NPDC097195 TaxID=3364141 RepID=UPI0038063988
MREKLSKPIDVVQTPINQLTPNIQKSTEPLIKIDNQHPRIFTQPVYYQQQIAHSLQSIYVRQNVLALLLDALVLLPDSYSLILYDGFRPIEVQQYLFRHFAEQITRQQPGFTKDTIFNETLKYVAFPKIGQEHLLPHLTGGAVDITLGDVNGKALDLGTAFDEMSAKSATCYFEQHPDENKAALNHRRLLYHCLTTVGFTNYAEEWWHYDFHNIAWARRVNANEAKYGAIEANVKNHLIKEYRYL